MDQQLENQLSAKFPFMQRDESKSRNPYSIYGSFGCTVGDGWYGLLDELCAGITAIYTEAGMAVDLVVDEVGVTSAADGQYFMKMTPTDVEYHELVFRYHTEYAEEQKGDNAAAESEIRQTEHAVRAKVDGQAVHEKTAEHAVRAKVDGQAVHEKTAVHAVYTKVAELVQSYRDKSRTVCEACGAQGVLRQGGKKIAVWCDSCIAGKEL